MLEVDEGEVVGFDVDAAAGEEEIGEEGCVRFVARAGVVRVMVIRNVLVLSQDVFEDAVSNFSWDTAVEQWRICLEIYFFSP